MCEIRLVIAKCINKSRQTQVAFEGVWKEDLHNTSKVSALVWNRDRSITSDY